MTKVVIFCLLISFSSYSKLLDKVAGVINDKIITLSEIKRIHKTLPARAEISPLIFESKKISNEEILDILIRIFIIKDKLSELGFVINDDSVESTITDTEKRLGLRRAQLLKFLNQKGISFEEYFELIRVTKEYNIFVQRIIAPLVSITEQDLKNYYYANNKNSKTLSFKYNVVDFYFNQNEVPKNQIKHLPKILAEYQRSGNIPPAFKDFQTNNLGSVSDDDLPSDLSKTLQSTNENEFSKPFIRNNLIHSFFLKSKELTESADYLEKKEFIYNQLFMQKSDAIIDSWFEKERFNYYILNNLWFILPKVMKGELD